MDVNQARAEARGYGEAILTAVKAVEDAYLTGDGATLEAAWLTLITAVSGYQEACEAIDRWMVSGGFAPTAWTETTTRIEIAISTNEDDVDVAVFVDGEPVTDAEITVVDPGKGHVLSDWRQSRDHSVATASPQAAEIIRQFYDGGESTKYVN